STSEAPQGGTIPYGSVSSELLFSIEQEIGIDPFKASDRKFLMRENRGISLSVFHRRKKRHVYHVEGNPRRPAQTLARCGRGRQGRHEGVSVRSAGYPGKDGSAKDPSTREGGSRSKSGGQG